MCSCAQSSAESYCLLCDMQEAEELERIMSGELPAGWEDALPTFTPEDKGLATRLHSQTMLNALANVMPGEPCSRFAALLR